MTSADVAKEVVVEEVQNTESETANAPAKAPTAAEDVSVAAPTGEENVPTEKASANENGAPEADAVKENAPEKEPQTADGESPAEGETPAEAQSTDTEKAEEKAAEDSAGDSPAESPTSPLKSTEKLVLPGKRLHEEAFGPDGAREVEAGAKNVSEGA